MKKIMAVLLALIVAVSLAACTEQARTEIIYVHTQSLRTIGEAEIRMDYEYSSTGTPVSVKTYFNGELYQSTSTRTSGGITYLTMTDAQGNSSTQSTEYTYDDNGNLTQLSMSIGGTLASYTNYTYDEDGNVLTALSVTSSANILTEYTYDENGNVTTQTQTNQNDGSYSRTEYTYNEDNYVIREAEYDAEGALVGAIECSYAENDAQKTMTYLDGAGEPTGEVVTEIYDEHGNMVQEITYMDGEVVQTIVNTYVAMEVPVEDE